MPTSSFKSTRLRSFVRRGSRKTKAQVEAHASLWPHFGLSIEQGLLDYEKVFSRVAPRFLEIGFGSGQSLLAIAKAHPEIDFIGVETHKPGIGALLLGMQLAEISNIRIYDNDVVDVFEKCIPNASLDGMQIFFPDPWPKRRHHPRRLIQADFIRLASQKLKPQGILHLATDWEDYAHHMMRIISQEKSLINMMGENHFATRSPYRPIITKFERRAERERRLVWELQFKHV